MANWYGVSRSNYFAVKDFPAFKEEMEAFEIEVHKEADGLRCCLISNNEYGDWPSYTYDEDGNDVEIDIVERIAKHLVDGEICVLQSSGAEKARYVSGWSAAFTNAGQQTAVFVNIDDIYDRATERFGRRPTEASY